MNNEFLRHGENPIPEEIPAQRPHEIFADGLSVAEINQLRGGYNSLVNQNKNLQNELYCKRQELEEISAGVFLLAEVLGIDIPKKATATELIPEIAATIENENSKEEIQ